MNKKQYKIEYLLTRILGVFAKMLPLKTAHIIGDFLGDLFYYVIKIRKNVAYKNLKLAFGNRIPDKDIKKILRGHYRHFGRVLMEFARIPRLKKETIAKEIPIHNLEILNQEITKNKGLIIVTGHFGNWEYLAGGLANCGHSLSCVYREQKNVAVDNVIKNYRRQMGFELLKVKGGAAKGMISVLKKKKMILSVMDQDAGGKGIFVDFLGHAASTNRGTAALAIKYRVPIVMAFGVREKDGIIHVYIERFKDIDQFSQDENGIVDLIKEYNNMLEKYIRKYPEQWFWMHRRWKTQPKSISK